MEILHSVVPRALTEVLRRGPMSQGKLEVAWRVAVGDTLCRVASVTLSPDGSVSVQPVDQRWHRELTRSSAMILGRLNSLLGAGSVAHLTITGGPTTTSRRSRASH